ncbi:MAG: penicillin-binding protein activator LpoB [Deltaproteobacteria bacterium]|nr:penicillin-binding protein activator LpoB [Deltaproteobacteria bacterium]
MKLVRMLVVSAAIMPLVSFGCGGPKKVTRTAADSTEGGDLSGYWNDIDAQQVSKAMIEDCFMSPWVSNFQEENGGKKPVVKLMGVIKRTDDRNVNTEYFSKQLERQMLNSGRVRVVAAWGQDQINVIARDRQATHASDETAKSHGNEVGEDFTLQTIVNSQNESDGGGKSVRAYLVNMELVNTETNEKVWIGEKAIRKVIDQAGTTW